MLLNLQSIGVDDLPLCWIADFLCDRSSSARVAQAFFSQWFIAASGALQRSVLGPFYSWHSLTTSRQLCDNHISSMRVTSIYGVLSDQQPTDRPFKTIWIDWRGGDKLGCFRPTFSNALRVCLKITKLRLWFDLLHARRENSGNHR